MKLKIWQRLGRSALLSLLFMAVGVATGHTQTSDPPALSAAKPHATQVINETAGATEPALYIVRLQDPALASYKGGIAGLAATSPRVTGAVRLDVAAPASQAYLSFLEAQQQTAIVAVEQRLGRPVEVAFQFLAALNAFGCA